MGARGKPEAQIAFSSIFSPSPRMAQSYDQFRRHLRIARILLSARPHSGWKWSRARSTRSRICAESSARGAAAQFLIFYGRHFNVNVDAVDQRP